MKAKFTHWYNALAATLLSLLGFSSCDKIGLGGEEPCLYGTPTSTYQVKGNVTDEAGTPVEGIKAIISEVEEYSDKEYVHHIDSAYTDKDGNYKIKDFSTFPGNERLKVLLEDVDGEKNGGTFANDTIANKDFTTKKVGEGSGSWNWGTYEVTANAKLKKKQ